MRIFENGILTGTVDDVAPEPLDDVAALLAATDPDVLRRALVLADGLTQPAPAAALAAAVAAENPQEAAVVLDTAVQATQEAP